MKIWIAGLVAVFLTACSTPADDSGGGGDAKKADEGDEGGAQVVCEDFVKRQLKSPTSADFGDVDVSQVKGPVWEVAGEVDSDNSFGASIRNDYTCRVKFKGDDDWALVKMTGLKN